MKFFGTFFAALLASNAAFAGMASSPVSVSSGNGAKGALILLLLLGAVVLLGRQGQSGAKAPVSTQTEQDDSNVIMKF